MRVGSQDVYASTVGGVRLAEPGVDLGVAVAVASAATELPIGDRDVVLGEIGLGGEVRQATHARRRLAEAARLGFRRAIVPASSPPGDGIEVVLVRSLGEALAAVGIVGGPRSRSGPAGPAP